MDAADETNGRTPLMIMCSIPRSWTCHVACFPYFDNVIDYLAQQSDIALTDFNNMTALHYACCSGQYYSSKVLLSLLKNRQQIFCLIIKDKIHYQTPAEIARSRGFVRIYSLFNNKDTKNNYTNNNDLIINNINQNDENANLNRNKMNARSTDDNEKTVEQDNVGDKNESDEFGSQHSEFGESELESNDTYNRNCKCSKCDVLTEMLDANAILFSQLQITNKKLTQKNMKLKHNINILNQHLANKNDLIFTLRSQLAQLVHSQSNLNYSNCG